MAEPSGRIKVNTGVAFQLASWFVSGLVAALVAYGAMNTRLSVLEDRVNRFASDIQEIKQDVKTLLRRP